MTVLSNSELTGITIDRKWDTKLLAARYASSVIMPLVLNKSDMVKDSGEIISIEIEPSLSSGTVTAATGAFTPAAPTPSLVNITVNTWKYVAIEITRQAEVQSFWKTDSWFPGAAAKRLAVDYDTDLAALHGSVAAGNTIGATDPGIFDDTMARAGLLRLSDTNVPKDSLTYVLPPVALYSGWYSKEVLTAAHSTGFKKNINISGEMPSILGVPVRESTTIATDTISGISVRKALLLHKQALGIGMQLNHSYKLVDRESAGFLSKAGVTNSLYGVAVVRSDHFIVFNVKAG